MRVMDKTIELVCKDYNYDRTRLLDILRTIQKQQSRSYITYEAMQSIAACLNIDIIEIKSVVSFYSFLKDKPGAALAIRLCNDIIDKLHGVDKVAEAFREALDIDFGQTTPDGQFSLEWTPCIGMCDQAPAALINDVVVTYLSRDKAINIIEQLRQHGDPHKLVRRLGDGNNAHPLVHSMVHNGIRLKGPVVFGKMPDGAALDKAVAMSPMEVIKAVTNARLRGRGGAGFPTGLKWQFTRAAEGDKKTVICNADEGEPGTFKDRVILTERPHLMFEGMAVAAYAIGATEGIIYLRGEYAYLAVYLEEIMQQRRNAGYLGRNICGVDGFDFDIKLIVGAGSYICGEETALISSCEGDRGDPKNRPPYPAQSGYMGKPTCVNNVETFCKAARILEKGVGWFAEIGTIGSPGTKLLSVCGDCSRPGVYEFPFGTSLTDLLTAVGAEDAYAVQIGGASGQMIDHTLFDRLICYDDLATGGSVIVFNKSRNPLQIASHFLEFFIDESCGFCTPCRVGNILLKRKLDDILAGNGNPDDISYLEDLAETIKLSSRCGLGQTATNCVTSTLKNFRHEYDRLMLVSGSNNGFLPTFRIEDALRPAKMLSGRESRYFNRNAKEN